MISLTFEEGFKLHQFSEVLYDSPEENQPYVQFAGTCCVDFSLMKHHIIVMLGPHADLSKQQHPPHQDQNGASCLHI